MTTTLTSTNPQIVHIETQLSLIEDKKAAAQRIVQFNMDLQSSTLVNRTLQGRDGKGLEVTTEQLALMEELGLSARIVANFTKDSLEKLNSRAIRAQVEVAQATASQTQLLMDLGAANSQQSQVVQPASVAAPAPPAPPAIWMLNEDRKTVPFVQAQATHSTLVNLGEGWITASDAGLVPAPPAPPAEESDSDA